MKSSMIRTSKSLFCTDSLINAAIDLSWFSVDLHSSYCCVVLKMSMPLLWRIVNPVSLIPSPIN